MNIAKAITDLNDNLVSFMKKVNYKKTNQKISDHSDAIDKAKNDINNLNETTDVIEDALCEVAEVDDGNKTDAEEALCDLAEAIDNAIAEIEEALCDLAEANETEV